MAGIRRSAYLARRTSIRRRPSRWSATPFTCCAVASRSSPAYRSTSSTRPPWRTSSATRQGPM